MTTNRKELIRLHQIVKSYQNGDQKLQVLKNIDLTVYEGEFLAIMGPSGSGKSTLMNIIGLLDSPTSGDYSLNGKRVEELSQTKLAQVRNKEIGFVFQQFFLLSKLTALQNVELRERMNHLPTELSGGQKQRVAIARALVNSPSIILADEPTGALDTKTGEQIMQFLTELNQEGKTIIMVTHEPEIADYATRKIVIRDGEITADTTDSIRID
ncbi:TPA: ABC transporter ATP-binding protein [Streptococcus agalactiae]|nr:ABC transporter ATP-binding protein [Streptococcus agalactiae]